MNASRSRPSRKGSDTEKLQPRGDEFARLPDEILLHIFSKLPQSALFQVVLVSKRCHRLARDETLWKAVDLSRQTLKAGTLGNALICGTLSLDLFHAKVTDPVFLENLPEDTVKIQRLDLEYAQISYSGLISVLSQCRDLQKLNLLGLDVNDGVCAAIGACRDLRTVNMDCCYGVSVAGITAIARGCQRITSWDLRHTRPSEYGFMALAEEISPTIQILDISLNQTLKDKHIDVLVNRCPNITKLNLNSSPNITEDTITFVLRLKMLESIFVGKCRKISFTSLCRFREMKSLRKLGVTGPMGLEEKEMLEGSLPGVEITTW